MIAVLLLVASEIHVDASSSCVTSAQLGDNSLPFDDGASSDSSCDTLADSGPSPATPPRPEMVAVISADVRCYVIEGQSHDGHFFWIWHTIDGITRHGCTPAGQGGCNVDSSSPDPTVGHW